MRTKIVTRAVLGATGILAAVAMTACSGSLTASGTASGTPAQGGATIPATSADPAGSSTGSTNGSSGGSSGGSSTVEDNGGGNSGEAAAAPAAPPVAARSGSTDAAVTPECKAGNLKLSFGGGDAGMSHEYQVLRFTNAGAKPCVIVGFPGVSYVAGDNGTQVGAPAMRDGKIGAQTTLQPGGVASTVITAVEVGVFDPSTCRPTPVRGYRVYAPDDKAAMFIPLPGQQEGCAGTSQSPQLTVHTIKPGLGDPDQP